jgi:hypothetical protein
MLVVEFGLNYSHYLAEKFWSRSRDLHSILSELVTAKRSCAPNTLWGMRGIRGLLGIASRRLLEYIRGIEASARATLSKPGTVSLCIGQFFTTLPTVKRKRVVFSSLQGRCDSGWALGLVRPSFQGCMASVENMTALTPCSQQMVRRVIEQSLPIRFEARQQ